MMKNIKSIYRNLSNFILILVVISILLYLDTTNILLCQDIENNSDVIYLGVEQTTHESTESMLFLQKSEESFIQRRYEQVNDLRTDIWENNYWARPKSDYVLYSDGSFISEDRIISVSSTPSEYGSFHNSNLCTEESFPTISFRDNTVRGSGFEERIHPMLRDNTIIMSNELSINKKGLVGKAKLCFDSVGSNVVRVYVKYQDLGKRKFLWHLWEKNRNDFESYAEFKECFDPKMSVFKKIKKDIKTDLKTEIKELLHTKDPFARGLNNKKVNVIAHRTKYRG
jgi:hypothetical protein